MTEHTRKRTALFKILVYLFILSLLLNGLFIFIIGRITTRCTELDSELKATNAIINRLEIANEGLKNEVDVYKQKLETSPQWTEIPLCSSNSVKTYEDGSIDWNISSQQHKIMQTLIINDRGHYTDGEYIAIAMGAYFGSIGEKFKITLDTGKIFHAVKVDEKATSQLINACSHPDGSMIEFVVDTDTAMNHYGGDNGYVLNGNFNNVEEFRGNIVKIERRGNWDEVQSWR